MKNVGFPCVFAQNGPPKGAQKWSQNGAKNEPEMKPNLGQKVVVHRNRSLLGTRPKRGGRKFLENLLENCLDG